MIFRVLSRNKAARSRENDAFMRFLQRTKRIGGGKSKAKDRVEVKCTLCGAYLRVPNVRGRHTVKCPRCGGSFETLI